MTTSIGSSFRGIALLNVNNPEPSFFSYIVISGQRRLLIPFHLSETKPNEKEKNGKKQTEAGASALFGGFNNSHV
jgi:hypothetical protein